MNCAEAREGLSAALDGALGAEELRAVEAHAASCAECRRVRDELADVRRLLRGVDDADDVPGRTAAIGRGVLAAIAHPPPTEADLDRSRAERSGIARRMVWTLVGGVVAAVLLSVIVGTALTIWWVRHWSGLRAANPPGASGPAAPAPRSRGRLIVSAKDRGVRDQALALFKDWSGNIRVDQADTDNRLFSLTVDFRGQSDEVERLKRRLSDLHDANASVLMRWEFSITSD